MGLIEHLHVFEECESDSEKGQRTSKVETFGRHF